VRRVEFRRRCSDWPVPVASSLLLVQQA